MTSSPSGFRLILITFPHQPLTLLQPLICPSTRRVITQHRYSPIGSTTTCEIHIASELSDRIYPPISYAHRLQANMFVSLGFGNVLRFVGVDVGVQTVFAREQGIPVENIASVDGYVVSAV